MPMFGGGGVTKPTLTTGFSGNGSMFGLPLPGEKAYSQQYQAALQTPEMQAALKGADERQAALANSLNTASPGYRPDVAAAAKKFQDTSKGDWTNSDFNAVMGLAVTKPGTKDAAGNIVPYPATDTGRPLESGPGGPPTSAGPRGGYNTGPGPGPTPPSGPRGGYGPGPGPTQASPRGGYGTPGGSMPPTMSPAWSAATALRKRRMMMA